MPELKEDLKNIEWKAEQLKKQADNLENLFRAWRYSYSILEDDIKALKSKIKKYEQF